MSRQARTIDIEAYMADRRRQRRHYLRGNYDGLFQAARLKTAKSYGNFAGRGAFCVLPGRNVEQVFFGARTRRSIA